MTPAELRVCIAQLGLGRRGFASTFDMDESTVGRYLSGDLSVPTHFAILIRILVANRRWGELLKIGYGGN